MPVTNGSDAGSNLSAALINPAFLAEFLFFHSSEVDKQRRATVCDLLLKKIAVGGTSRDGDAASGSNFTSFLCNNEPAVRQRYERLLQRLLCVCLGAVAADSTAMQETRLLVLLTDSETWHAGGGGYSKVDASEWRKRPKSPISAHVIPSRKF